MKANVTKLVAKAKEQGREVWARKIRAGQSTTYALPNGQWGRVSLFYDGTTHRLQARYEKGGEKDG
jgi:hypothetical protein